MTSLRNPPRRQDEEQRKTYKMQWGTQGFEVLEPEPPFGFAESPSEVLPILLDDFTGGLRPINGIADWTTEDRVRYYRNTGIYGLWLPEPIGVKSYAITTQTSVVSVDHSTFNSGNKRVHAVMWPTASGQRFIAGALAQIYKDTSVSDPAIVVPATADNVTDDIHGMSVGVFSGSTVLAIVTDGQTDGAKYTTDPTADSITWTSLITYSHANDRGYWLYYIPTLGDGGRWVFCGKINNGTPAIYAFKPTDSAPLTNSTMQPVVYEATKDIEGSIATVTTSATSPGTGAPVTRSGNTAEPAPPDSTGSGTRAWWNGWVNASNVAADDANYATAQSNFEAQANTLGQTVESEKGILSDELWAVGYNFSSVPKAAIITGLQADVRVFEGNAGDNISWALAQFAVNGSKVGVSLADGTELSTDPGTDPTKTFGSSTNRWGTALRGEDIQHGLAFAMQFRADEGSSVTSNGGVPDTNLETGSVSVGHVPVTLTYRFPGTQVTTTEGEWSIGPMPSAPNFIPAVRPVSNDGTGVDVRRELVVYELLFDQLDRVTMNEVHRPDTGLAYVKDICHFQGGLALAGGATFDGSLKFMFTRFSGSEWITDPLNFPITHGSEQQDMYFMAAQDKDLIVGVCDSDGGDRQLWKFNFDTGWHPFGALQSISGTTISSKPLLWAERTLNLEQAYHYAPFPNSTTSLHIAREFVPPDLNADPRLVNTSVSKNATATRLTGLRLNYDSPNSPPPSFKTLLSAEVRNSEVDDGTTYGTVRVLFDQGGSFTFATAGAFDHTFDASSETFTPFFVRNGGLVFDSGIVGIEAGASTGARTPNILPVLLKFASQTESDRTFTFTLAPNQDWQDIVAQLETLKRSGNVRSLIFPEGFPFSDQDGNRNVPAIFSGISPRGQLVFREVPGTVATS